MSSSAISRRYAKALVSLASEKQKVEQYGEELARARAAFAAEDNLRFILTSPTYSQEKKTAILADVADLLKLSEDPRKFLGLLLEKDRLVYLPQIQEVYREYADELSGVLRARVSAPRELDKKQREAIRGGLEQQTGKRVELQEQIDPSLIGGLQAQIGGKVFDGSIRTQLKRIEDTLKKG